MRLRMKIILHPMKGHSPKNRFLEEWIADFLAGKDLSNRVKEGVSLPAIPTISQGARVEIVYGISHGKSGAVLVEIEGDPNYQWLSFHLEFTTFKADTIGNVILTKG